VKLMIFIGSVVGSSVGWWLGGLIDEGLGWPFVLSSVFMLVGIYAGWSVGKNME
jgi:hypothetical protein